MPFTGEGTEEGKSYFIIEPEFEAIDDDLNYHTALLLSGQKYKI